MAFSRPQTQIHIVQFKEDDIKIEVTRHYSTEWTACKPEWDLDDPIGTGCNADDAIADLLEQLEDA